jgi:hypothetical protein
MSNRFTVYASEHMQQAIKGHEDNRSARLSLICQRYAAIIAEDAPKHWTPEQWTLARKALAGSSPGDDPTLRYLWAEIAQSGEPGADDLAEEVRRMTLGQRIAIAENIQTGEPE